MLYKSLIRPVLFQCSTEWVHEQALKTLAWMQNHPDWFQPMSDSIESTDSRLSQTLFGVHYAHPVGLAAGFDKNAELTQVMRYFGFGFSEVGSISFYPCKGNPSPRLFRLPNEEALINRMGLNNHGILDRLPALKQLPTDFPVGINLTVTPQTYGMAAIEDICHSYQMIHGLGAYAAFNISCPNTEDGKTFEDPEKLKELLEYLSDACKDAQRATGQAKRPWFLKISADTDETQLKDLLDVCSDFEIEGFICTNTTQNRSVLKNTSPIKLEQIGRGGLSGKPIQELSTQRLGFVYQNTRHWKKPPVLIGVGGVHSVESAWEKIINGASLVQLYTGWIYEGPFIAKTIAKGLQQKCVDYGFENIQQAVGRQFN